MTENLTAITFNGGELLLLDQRELPIVERWEVCKTAQDVTQAIQRMVVRGAPAIGIAAAYGMVLASEQATVFSADDWLAHLNRAADKLNASRPTAVNLAAATGVMMRLANRVAAESNRHEVLERRANKLHEDDVAMNRAMALAGSALISPNSTVMTHCNTGALATGGVGTALGVISHGAATGVIRHVYACETRPWLQGSRLTMWELTKNAVPATLITDSAAASVIRDEKIDWIIVGADRIAADGSVANKIGTYSLAVLAKHHGAKFMVVAPHTTVDLGCLHGQDIDIEVRNGQEISQFRGLQIAPNEADCFNPAFDVTPPDLIDTIVTDRCVVNTPAANAIQLQSASIEV